MGSLTNYGENKFLEHLCSTPYSPAATLYLALCTGDPGEAASGDAMNEAANANNYSRTAISFAAASARRVTQTGAVTFPQATGAWGTITHWAIVDSGTYGLGNVLAYGACSPSFNPVSGSTPSVSTGIIYVEAAASSGKGFTTYFVNKMLDLMFRNVAYSQPATYVALLDQAGADADTTLTTAGKEVSGLGYARTLVNKAGGTSPAWNAVANGVTDNAHGLVFPTVGAGGWSQVTGAALVDGGTLDAGNVLMFDNDIVDQTPQEGDTVDFPAGAFDLAAA